MKVIEPRAYPYCPQRQILDGPSCLHGVVRETLCLEVLDDERERLTECTPDEQKAIRECPHPECPLYELRPYQAEVAE